MSANESDSTPDNAAHGGCLGVTCSACGGSGTRIIGERDGENFWNRCVPCKCRQMATDPVAITALVAVLGDAQSARLTATKTETVLKRDGYRITGFVLCHPETGRRCIVEMSACRWLSKEESWWLMHESESPIYTANA